MKLKTEFLTNEYWWGGCVEEGVKMPISSQCNYSVDLLSLNIQNQSAPIFVSNMGRSIVSDKPFVINFKQGIIEACGNGEILLETHGTTLRDAYLAVSKKYMNFNGQIPPELFFEKPQYNTWIELNHNQTQAGVMRYAKSILEIGLPAGILMIDAMWSDFFGSFIFHTGRFPDARKMISELHDMGFKVMVWVSPLISPDSITYRELRNTDILIKQSDGNLAVRKWWDGYSCVLDLTCPNAIEWLHEKLESMMINYGVDGFKIDAGDNYLYNELDSTYEKKIPNEHSKAVCEFALKYRFNECRTGWNVGGYPLVMRLCDKNHSWDNYGINTLIPNSLLQGVLGYAYSCPDMIGGGEYISFNENKANIDQELFVRYAQVCALMPMMQFSALPSNFLSVENLEYVKEAAKLHMKFDKQILELAHNASKTGEPIVRYMEYQFPHMGFETCSDQFMLGQKIIVAPALKKGMLKRTVKLPAGAWVSDKGEKIIGPAEFDTDTPINRLPYYVLEET